MTARHLTVTSLVTLAMVAALWLAVGMDGNSRARACGIAGPYDFDTFESGNSAADYSFMIELAAYGRVVSPPFAAAPPPPNLPGTTSAPLLQEAPVPVGQVAGADFTYPGLERGDRLSRTPADRANVIPPGILKSIAWIEGSWTNAENTVPWGAVGPVVRSFDCGYGLGQVTSGMENSTGTPSIEQALIGTHPAFNLAEAARILAGKWNDAPNVRPIAGTGDPSALEDWYYAVWSYNGFAEVNHPLNPNRNPLRGERFHCYSPESPDVNNGFVYSDYTYPEKAYGCLQYPPYATIRGESVRLWESIPAQMPQMEHEEVAEAFDLHAYRACASTLDPSACAVMDYPTTLPAFTHPDDPTRNRPAVQVSHDPTVVDWNRESPMPSSPGATLVFSGPTSGSLTLSNGVSDSVAVSVANTGSGVGAYRISSSAPWLIVRHAREPWPDGSSRSLDGSVAVGRDVQVLVGLDEYQAGYAADLAVLIDPWRYPGGAQTGTVTFEPLNGTGTPLTISIAAQGPLGTPSPTATAEPTTTALPTATPPPTPEVYRNYVPNTSSGVQN